MHLVDSHCHLTMYSEQELLEILALAKESYVHTLQTICTNINDIPKIFKIIDSNEHIFGSIGIHPDQCMQNKITDYTVTHDAKILLDSLNIITKDSFLTTEQIISLSTHPKIIGIGETGLDYYHTKQLEEHKHQQNIFVNHIHASQASKLPIIIHTRDAENDTIDILKSEMKNQTFTGLIHCFTASKDFAKKILDLGLYISFSGIITFKKATELQEIVKFIPLSNLLIETDSPFLAPEPMRGKINQPAYVKYIAEKISILKQCSIHDIAISSTDNFFKLFNKAINNAK